MIRLTSTDGKPIVINAMCIETIQGSMISMNGGHVHFVRETFDEICVLVMGHRPDAPQRPDPSVPFTKR